jgi:signal transduction histidine kinase
MIDIPDARDAPSELATGAQYFLTTGYRAITIMPMMRGGDAIGALSVVRAAPGALSEKQIAVLKTFANQAIIAIENTRLLNELRERTDDLSESLEQQTATSEVLRVISSSPTNVQPVFDAIAESAVRLCDGQFSFVVRFNGKVMDFASCCGLTAEGLDAFHSILPMPASEYTAAGRAIVRRAVVEISDVETDPSYGAQAQGLAKAVIYRSIAAVPLLHEGNPIGAIAVARANAGSFPKRQIVLLQAFADQAVIAIANVRLFDEVQARTRELAKSLDDLRTTQDRLVQTQKLASLGQLTAGIAHEIKNPLNFVNNFSGLSSELIDELQEALGDVSLIEKRHSEITELMDTLRGNLDKVIQHGKRADAIVKNMLQHSREGSGEHGPVDINALVEECLTLAWHGARAEKQGFAITRKQSFDPSAGEVDIFPQDLTRALLNLISNGFYAATKRNTATNGSDYEPTLTASTRNLGDRVEIRIRDNGTGIPPDVKEKMFNPFFTTKPTGEGTGLGLSISHDIIVKQHAGSIDVDTQPGEFTEIIVTLPRAAVFV